MQNGRKYKCLTRQLHYNREEKRENILLFFFCVQEMSAKICLQNISYGKGNPIHEAYGEYSQKASSRRIRCHLYLIFWSRGEEPEHWEQSESKEVIWLWYGVCKCPSIFRLEGP